MTLLGFGGSGTSSPVFTAFLTRPSPSARQTVPAAAGREATILRSRTLMWSGMVYQSILVAGEARYDFWTLVSGRGVYRC